MSSRVKVLNIFGKESCIREHKRGMVEIKVRKEMVKSLENMQSLSSHKTNKQQQKHAHTDFPFFLLQWGEIGGF